VKLAEMIAALGTVGIGLVAGCSSSSAGGVSGDGGPSASSGAGSSGSSSSSGGESGQQGGNSSGGAPGCSATATALVIEGLSQAVNITGVDGAGELSNTSWVFSVNGGSEGIVGTQLNVPDTGTLESGQDLTVGDNGTVFRIRASGGSFGTLSETLDNGSKIHIGDFESQDGGGLPSTVRITFDGTTSGHAVSGCETYIKGA
jgi:hypothetical protein